MLSNLRKAIRSNPIFSMERAGEGVNGAIGGCAAMVNTAVRWELASLGANSTMSRAPVNL